MVAEGFGHPNSEPEVDDAVRAAVDVLRGAGLSAEDVSIPWHLHGARIWDVIATEGAAAQMVDANGYGMNWEGLYDPEVIEYYGNQWRADGSQFSETVKLVLLAGRSREQAATGASTTRWPATSSGSCGPAYDDALVALRRAGDADDADPARRSSPPPTRPARRSSSARWR